MMHIQKSYLVFLLPLWFALCYLMYKLTTRTDDFHHRTFRQTGLTELNTTIVIHIGFVLRGESTFLRAKTLLKSILFYQGRLRNSRQPCVVRINHTNGKQCPRKNLTNYNPLHVHLVTENRTRDQINSFFVSVRLPALQWTVYDIDPHLKYVIQFPNGHDTGPAAMVKIMWPFILGRGLDKFISLDSDVLFNYNIADLWSLFDTFNQNQALGLAYESDAENIFFHPSNSYPYPLSGLNSGIILWYMNRIRQLPWKDLIQKGVAIELRKNDKLNGDQSVFNGIIKYEPSLYYTLNCEWHVQMWNERSGLACPVVWPEREPNESDCISSMDRIGTKQRPNLLRIAHFNTAVKPENGDWNNSFRVQQITLTRLSPSLEIMELRARFYAVYRRFCDLPIQCFGGRRGK